jgi:hypothetical protein
MFTLLCKAAVKTVRHKLIFFFCTSTEVILIKICLSVHKLSHVYEQKYETQSCVSA